MVWKAGFLALRRSEVLYFVSHICLDSANAPEWHFHLLANCNRRSSSLKLLIRTLLKVSLLLRSFHLSKAISAKIVGPLGEGKAS